MEKEKKRIQFAEWWGNIPQAHVEQMRKEIMDKCFVSRFVISHWVSGRTEIPELALPIIEEIAGKEIFNKEIIKEV